jgi:hypothetical protein
MSNKGTVLSSSMCFPAFAIERGVGQFFQQGVGFAIE